MLLRQIILTCSENDSVIKHCRTIRSKISIFITAKGRNLVPKSSLINAEHKLGLNLEFKLSEKFLSDVIDSFIKDSLNLELQDIVEFDRNDSNQNGFQY